jgi:rhamnosyltransferase
MSHPPISVVIRTLNSADTLKPVLEATRLSPEDQLIVVDSGSTDGTLDLVRQYDGELVSIRPAEFTYGRALNIGFAKARHEWVLALSSHTVPVRPDFLELYRRAIREHFTARVAVAVGPLLMSEFDTTLPGGITYFEQGDFRKGFGFGAGNPNSLYRRSVWQQRGFDEALPGGEDLEWYVWALAQGHQIAAIHAAEVRYISRRPAKAFYMKGRVDHRISARLIEAHQPSLPGIVIRCAKLLLYTAMGRVDWHGAKGSLFHCLGTYVEARALRKSGHGPVHPANSPKA